MERPKSCRAHLGLMAFAMTTTLTLTVTHLEMKKKMPEVFFERVKRGTYFVFIIYVHSNTLFRNKRFMLNKMT